MSLLSQQIPPITPEFLYRMEQAFRPHRITRDKEPSAHQVSYDAGAQAVIAWARQHVRGTYTPTETPEEPVAPSQPEPAPAPKRKWWQFWKWF